MSGPPPPTAADITIAPIAGLSATNVQEALEEVTAKLAPTVGMLAPTMGSGKVAPNPGVPALDQPQADLVSLRTVLVQARLGLQSLGGQRGGPLDRAVTLQDLVSLGLTTQADILGKLPDTAGRAPPP